MMNVLMIVHLLLQDVFLIVFNLVVTLMLILVMNGVKLLLVLMDKLVKAGNVQEPRIVQMNVGRVKRDVPIIMGLRFAVIIIQILVLNGVVKELVLLV